LAFASQISTLQSPWGARSFLRVPHPRFVRVGLFHSLNTRRPTSHAPLAHAGTSASLTRDLPSSSPSRLPFRLRPYNASLRFAAARHCRAPIHSAAERRLYPARHAARLPYGRRREVPGTPQHKHSPGGAVDLPLQFSSLEPKSWSSQLSNFNSPIALGRSFVFAGAPSSVCEGGAFPFTQHAAHHESPSPRPRQHPRITHARPSVSLPLPPPPFQLRPHNASLRFAPERPLHAPRSDRPSEPTQFPPRPTIRHRGFGR